VDYIKMNLWRDRIGWCGLEWCGSVWEQVETSCDCRHELSDSIKHWVSWVALWPLVCRVVLSSVELAGRVRWLVSRFVDVIYEEHATRQNRVLYRMFLYVW
jgi:hypothetical protein